MLMALACCAMSSCNSDEPTLGKDKNLTRFDISNGDALTILGNVSSRAMDGDFSKAGMYKIDNNGNITAVGVFVNEDGKESLSDLTVTPYNIYNLTEDYMYFEWCSYYDADGDPVSASDEYRNLIVRRSDGLIFSAKGIYDSSLGVFGNPMSSYFEEDGQHRLICAISLQDGSSVTIGRVTLSTGLGTWEQLTTDGWPFNGMDFPHLVQMHNGVIATSCNFPSIDDLWNGTAIGQFFGGRTVGIIYPNGGYDVFGSSDNWVTRYATLENGLLEMNTESLEVKYVTIGSSYGQSNSQKVGNLQIDDDNIDIPTTNLFAYTISSWYETANKVLIKFRSSHDVSSIYQVYDKQSKSFSLLTPEFDGEDNIELWKRNLCDGRFYCLIRENDKVTKVGWIDPSTLTTGTTPIHIANEIDITTFVTDYPNGTALLTGTRRSDGWKVAVSLDLKTGQYSTLFNDPNRPIITLLPLN